MRDLEHAADLGESEVVPDFQNDHLPLFIRQTFDRRGQLLLAFVEGGKLRLEMRRAVEGDGSFAASAAFFAAQAIERGGADGGVKKGAVFDRMLAAPKADEGFLHNVFGFGAAVRPAPGEEKKGRAELSETGLPIVFAARSLHFFFTSFRLRRRQMQLLSNDVKTFLSLVCSLVLFSGAASLAAEDAAKTGNAKSLAAAETAFAQEALAKGTRTAFLHALSDNSTVFLPGPLNGKKAWEAKPESKAVLQWQPVLAATSTTGDFGYTTGPWSFKNDPADTVAATHGQFVSIWRWENGKWKLCFDLGSENPAPTAPAPELQLADNHAPNEAAEDAQPVMRAHDGRYAADRAGQLAGCAEDNIRLYLPKQFPIIGATAASAALQKETVPVKFSAPTGGEVSRGGDLGYVWGEYHNGAATEASGYYMRIWRKDRAGEWKLALDLSHPR